MKTPSVASLSFLSVVFAVGCVEASPSPRDAGPPVIDAGALDGGPMDAGVFDAGGFDAGGFDGGGDSGADAGPREDAGFDATVLDAAMSDAAMSDAAMSDAAMSDAAMSDGGTTEVFSLVTDTDRTFIGNTVRGGTWDRPESPDDSCPAASQPTVGAGTRRDFYRFRNEDSVTLIVAFDLDAGYDPHLTAYSGTSLPPDPLQCLAIDEDISSTNLNASLLFTMMPGETVLVVLGGHGVGDAGPYTFRAQAVPL